MILDRVWIFDLNATDIAYDNMPIKRDFGQVIWV